ncbi:hypothetical protein [Nitrosomonas mobilis]|uniref:Uncharacterized protein n=1 Tax=Nitrosomonas mobilis TaxID=51642 RepID=A0A1G5SHU1_9PROT|nr:hypothetical protein [Nitrosomonas mobilis]SCZ86776.1 hypothetical protein NSMM_780002 [Nitrosomonas mobilis]
MNEEQDDLLTLLRKFFKKHIAISSGFAGFTSAIALVSWFVMTLPDMQLWVLSGYSKEELLERAFSKDREKIENLHTKNRDLEKNNDELKNDSSSCKHSNEDLRYKNFELSKGLSQFTDSNKDLKSENTKLRQELSRFTDSNSSCGEHLKKAESEIIRIKRRYADEEKEHKDTKRLLEEEKNNSKNYQEKITKLEECTKVDPSVKTIMYRV